MPKARANDQVVPSRSSTRPRAVDRKTLRDIADAERLEHQTRRQPVPDPVVATSSVDSSSEESGEDLPEINSDKDRPSPSVSASGPTLSAYELDARKRRAELDEELRKLGLDNGPIAAQASGNKRKNGAQGEDRPPKKSKKASRQLDQELQAARESARQRVAVDRRQQGAAAQQLLSGPVGPAPGPASTASGVPAYLAPLGALLGPLYAQLSSAHGGPLPADAASRLAASLQQFLQQPLQQPPSPPTATATAPPSASSPPSARRLRDDSDVVWDIARAIRESGALPESELYKANNIARAACDLDSASKTVRKLATKCYTVAELATSNIRGGGPNGKKALDPDRLRLIEDIVRMRFKVAPSFVTYHLAQKCAEAARKDTADTDNEA